MKPVYTILFLLMTMSAFSQEKKWTLQECIQYAVHHNLQISKQQAQNNIYAQNRKEAVGRLLPSINAETGAYFNIGRGLDADNTYIDINSFNNDYGVYSSLTLFNGFANIIKVKMQKINMLMGKQQLQESQDMVAFETMEAFFYVLYYKKTVELAVQQCNETSELLRQVKRMEELGMKSFPDVAEIQAKEAADNLNLTRHKNLLTIGIIQLKEKMNLPVAENLDIEDFVSEEIVVKSEETAISIYENAKTFLPESLAAELAFRAQKLSYQSSVGSLLPALTLNSGYSTGFFRFLDGSRYAPFTQQIDEKRGYYAGVTLSVPVFNGFSKNAQIKRNKQQMLISQMEKDETLRGIYSEIEQILADMNGQADEYYLSVKQVEAAGIAHSVNRRKYTEGLINAIDLQASANRLQQAKIEELNALLKYYLKKKLLAYYKGDSLWTYN